MSALAALPHGGSVLSVRGLTRRFGGVVAVNDLDLDVLPGEVLGVIGPNGAGKSTLVGLIGGALSPTAGTVILEGNDVTHVSAARRARSGVGRTHQIPRPFARMSVLENLMLASGSVSSGRRTHVRRGECLGILERTGLADAANLPAGGLTLLRRKRLELARALALRPRLLMLDEIGAGLVEHETEELIELIRTLRHETEAMLLIEHVMDVITSCCDRTAVLDFGRLLTVGPTREVLADPAVAAVYLGTSATQHRVETGVVRAGAASQAEDLVAAAGESVDRLGAISVSAGSLDVLVTVPTVDETQPLLRVAELAVSYGGLRALRGVELTVGHGEAITLLGANGAGKTTLTRAISGALPLDSGTITFADTDVTGMRPDKIAALGIAQCMEGRRIFGTLTVEENLLLGAGSARSAVRRERLDSVYGIFPILADRRSQSGTTLSGGQQQMLAIGRALMSAPSLVVFDEISLGLAPIAVDRLYEALQAIRASGVAMILVEQNIARGLDLADRAYVLSQGKVALSGPCSEVRDNPALASLYVGEAADETAPDHPPAVRPDDPKPSTATREDPS